MEIIQIIGLALVATILVVLLREDRPEIALQMSIVLGVIVFLRVLDEIAFVVNILQEIAQKANIDTIYMSTILKILGISYIAEFGAQICKDAGSTSTAAKIEFASKIMILFLSLPILMAVLNLLLRILP